jgi:hypothetical protein
MRQPPRSFVGQDHRRSSITKSSTPGGRIGLVDQLPPTREQEMTQHPQNSDRRSARLMMTILSAVFALVAGLFVTNPATAALQLGNHTKVGSGASPRTIIGPTTNYNESELHIGCPSNYSVSVNPTWRVSNVTSSSVYVDYVKVTWVPRQNIRLGFTSLVSGSTQVWAGNWLQPSIGGTVTKTYYFRRTVHWNGQLFIQQVFGFNGPSSVEPLCVRDLTYKIYLDRS